MLTGLHLENEWKKSMNVTYALRKPKKFHWYSILSRKGAQGMFAKWTWMKKVSWWEHQEGVGPSQWEAFYDSSCTKVEKVEVGRLGTQWLLKIEYKFRERRQWYSRQREQN